METIDRIAGRVAAIENALDVAAPSAPTAAGTAARSAAVPAGGTLAASRGITFADLVAQAVATLPGLAAGAVAPPAQDAAGAAVGARVAAAAQELVGTPYVWGGDDADGIDCSGLVQQAYAQVGIDVPHQSQAIRDAGTVVPRDQARPGDVIWSPGHVAIYLGGDQQVEASRQGGWDVAVRPIWQQDPVFLRLT